MSERFSSDPQKLSSPDTSGPGTGGGKSEKDSGQPEKFKKDGAVLVGSLIGKHAEAEAARQHPLPVGELFVKRGPDAIPEQERKRKKKKKRSGQKHDAPTEHAEPRASDELPESGPAEAGSADAEAQGHAKTTAEEKKKPADVPAEGKDGSREATDDDEDVVGLSDDGPKLFHEIPLQRRPGSYRGEVIVDLSGNKPPVIREAPAATEIEPELEAEETPETPEASADEPDTGEPAEEPAPEFSEPAPAAARPAWSERQSPRINGPVPLAGAGGGVPPFISGGVPLGAESPEPSPGQAEPTSTTEQSPEPLMMPVAASQRRMEPAEAYRMHAERDAAGTAAAGVPGEEMVTKQEVEKSAYYAERQGQSRGVLAGFVAAAWLARRRGKKLRRQFGETFNKQEKQHRQEREAQRIYSTEQAKRQAETDRRLAATETQLAYTQQEQMRRGNQQAHEQRAQMQTAERRDAELQERRQQLQAVEQGRAEAPQRTNDEAERLNVPPEHRLQTSAWHTIEVDARTGKPVEQPAFAYGHEYHRERAHEVRPDDERNAATGEVALAAASVIHDASGQGQGARQTGGGDASSPSSIPSATRQGPPSSRARSGSPSSPRDLVSRATAGGPIWPYILAIAVIFICIVFLV